MGIAVEIGSRAIRQTDIIRIVVLIAFGTCVAKGTLISAITFTHRGAALMTASAVQAAVDLGRSAGRHARTVLVEVLIAIGAGITQLALIALVTDAYNQATRVGTAAVRTTV